MNPRLVKFGATVWDQVTSVSVDRSGERVISGHTDLGAYVAMVDVPEQRVSVRVARELQSDDLNGPRPGDSATLMFFTSPSGTDGGRRKVSMTAVVTGVRHLASGARGFTRTVEMLAVSSDGAADPITISDAGGEV